MDTRTLIIRCGKKQRFIFQPDILLVRQTLNVSVMNEFTAFLPSERLFMLNHTLLLFSLVINYSSCPLQQEETFSHFLSFTLMFYSLVCFPSQGSLSSPSPRTPPQRTSLRWNVPGSRETLSWCRVWKRATPNSESRYRRLSTRWDTSWCHEHKSGAAVAREAEKVGGCWFDPRASPRQVSRCPWARHHLTPTAPDQLAVSLHGRQPTAVDNGVI